MNVQKLRNNSDYFEDIKIRLAEKLKEEAEEPMSFLDAIDLAHDQLMVKAGF